MWSLACVLVAIYALLRAWLASGLTWMDFVILRGAFVYCRLLHRWSANRSRPFPPDGPAIVYSNHTCSADAAFLLAACDRPLGFLVASEHFNVHPVAHAVLKHLRCVAVIRTGQHPHALRRALAQLQQGAMVGVFPEGNLSGVGLGRRRTAKPGVAFLALVSRAPVYPAYIAGGPRTDQLLNSWVLPTRQAVHVTFGEPVDLAAYYHRPRTRALIEEVTGVLMAKIDELRKGA